MDEPRDGGDEPTRGDGIDTRQPSSTVGMGSSLAIGCVVAVLVLIVIAVALRAFTPLW
jgi:hypothetical protein